MLREPPPPPWCAAETETHPPTPVDTMKSDETCETNETYGTIETYETNGANEDIKPTHHPGIG